MFVILVYDSKNPNKFKKICRKYLMHVQKSVFEGEIKKENYDKLIKELNKISSKDDSYKAYITKSKKLINFYSKNQEVFNPL